MFRNFSIRRKLTAIILLTCTLVLLLISAIAIIHEFISFRRGMVHNISTLAKVISINSTATLAFYDPETAKEILSALSAEPYVLAACIYTAHSNEVFATYSKDKETDIQSLFGNLDLKDRDISSSKFSQSGYRFTNKYLEVLKPIVMNGKKIGKVYIRSDLKGLYYNLKLFIGIGTCILLSSFFLAYLLSSKLQRIISEPISMLARTMEVVSTEKNYLVRAKNTSNDELGLLIDGFNEMLEQLQIRDKKLNEAVSEMRKAKETAEFANVSKSDFLANMSHELRTPLNHIIGFTELVVDKHFGDLNETQQEYLNDVLDSGRHLLSLINDILDLSKVESGKLELNPADIYLKELLENSLIMVKEKVIKHGINLSANINDIPEIIKADERKLKQVMYNLLSNAVKFTPDGGSVNLSARQTEDASSQRAIEIRVSDSGIGMKKEDIARLLKPFEQADSSLSRRYEGTGLGLPITKRLIELHGGRILAESEGEGKGSTFSFFIPI